MKLLQRIEFWLFFVPALVGIVQSVIASKGKLQIDSEVGTVEQACFPSGFAAIGPLDDLLR